MKVTVLNQEKKERKNSFYSSIALLILGIVLTFHSQELISMIFIILGFIVLLYGIFKVSNFYKLKTQLQYEDNELITTGILYSIFGLIVILLSSFFASAIKIVTGIWLIFLGMTKIKTGMFFKNVDSKNFTIQTIAGIVLIVLGIYTILANNVVFIFIGVALIIYSILDLIDLVLKK